MCGWAEALRWNVFLRAALHVPVPWVNGHPHAVQHLRTLIYAFDRSLEGALAACGAPLVGYLAQHAFGFTVAHLAATVISCMQAVGFSQPCVY